MDRAAYDERERSLELMRASTRLLQEAQAEDDDTRRKLERFSTVLFWRGVGLGGSDTSEAAAATQTNGGAPTSPR